MIQFNLLPDVKLTYVKANRMKRLVTAVASIVAAATLAIAVILFVLVNEVQKAHINNLAQQITANTNTLKNTPNLNKILTIQNQIKALPDLQTKRPLVSRLFNYISTITPSAANISTMSVNYTTNNIAITGTADSLVTVDKFVDTLNFAAFTVANSTGTGSSAGTAAFSDIQLGSVALGQTATTPYSITFNFSPVLFDRTKNVTLQVPNLITTRSVLDQPSALFQSPASQSTSNGQTNH